jgi:subtilisin family serine protease
VGVINLSFGSPQRSDLLAALVGKAIEGGICVVGAAGNMSRSEPAYFPASLEPAIMVTAVDSADVKADFADWNSAVDIAAPGTGVRSAYPYDGWALGSGCSFATPFIAGEAALVLGIDPTLAPSQVRVRLRSAVKPIYQIPGNQDFFGELGTGRLYLPFAVDGTVAVPVSDVNLGPLSAWPNPARGAVRFRIAVATEAHEAIAIHDVAGRLVQTLHPRDGRAVWTGLGTTGRLVPPGVYYARLGRSGGTVRIQLVE